MYLSSNRFAALWDTGACGSVINSEVVARLGLMPSGTTEVFTANGLALQEIFDISIYLPGGLLIDCEVTCAELTTGHFSCLIGMDVIGKGDFAISNFEGKTVFSFRYPSLETIDFRE